MFVEANAITAAAAVAGDTVKLISCVARPTHTQKSIFPPTLL